MRCLPPTPGRLPNKGRRFGTRIRRHRHGWLASKLLQELPDGTLRQVPGAIDEGLALVVARECHEVEQGDAQHVRDRPKARERWHREPLLDIGNEPLRRQLTRECQALCRQAALQPELTDPRSDRQGEGVGARPPGHAPGR